MLGGEIKLHSHLEQGTKIEFSFKPKDLEVAGISEAAETESHLPLPSVPKIDFKTLTKQVRV